MPSLIPHKSWDDFLRLPWTNSFQGGQSCALYTPTFGFSYPLEALFLCTPRWALLTICTLCWDVLWLVPIAGICYSLYPLLVRATSCTHYWDMLTICTHYWDVLRLISINFCSWPVSWLYLETFALGQFLGYVLRKFVLGQVLGQVLGRLALFQVPGHVTWIILF